MAFLDNVLIPIIKTAFILGILGYICYVIARFMQRYYNQRLKFIIKYKVLKKPVPDSYVAWILEAMQKRMSREKVKMHLLMYDVNFDIIFEILYLYDKLKGGDRNGGNSERRDKEAEGKQLPSTTKKGK